MRKIVALLLSLVCTLSIACTVKAESDELSKVLLPQAEKDISFTNVNSIDSFVQYLENAGYEFDEKTCEDGSVFVELKNKNEPALTNTLKLAERETLYSLEKLADETVSIGDTNNDGKINNRDLALLMQYINKWQVNIHSLNSDINSDGKINNKDYAALMQQINGWNPTYTYVTGQTHQKLHYSKRYLYSLLTDEQKEWYSKIDVAINNLEDGVVLGANIVNDKNYLIYYMYIFDNPEHFYLANSMTLYKNAENSSISFKYAVGKEKGEYTNYNAPLTEELKEKIIQKKAAFEAEANRILSTIPANAPDVWKERLIYDRILMDGHYNLGAQWDGLANDNWTAYGLLVNKYGVCESYSEAFQTLCLYAGIRCTGVVGDAGGGHKWNAVELDGEWYMCDITFDDPIGGEAGAAYHLYFNRTSQWFTEHNHDWSNCDFDVPECNGTEYDFEKYFGESRW